MATTPSYVSRDSVDELDTLTPGRSHYSHSAQPSSSTGRAASPSARAAASPAGSRERGGGRGRGRARGAARGLAGGLRARGGRVSAPTRVEEESDYEPSEQPSDRASLRSPTPEDEDEEEEEEQEAALEEEFEDADDQQRDDDLEGTEDGMEEDREESEEVRRLGPPAAPRRIEDSEARGDEPGRRLQQPRRVPTPSPSPRPSPPVSSSPMPPPPVSAMAAEPGPSRPAGNHALGEPMRLASPKVESETPVPFDHRVSPAPGIIMGPPASANLRPPGARSSASPDHGVFARPLPPQQIRGQHQQPEGEGEGERQSVIVFQCDGCKSILGDSLSWVCARQDLGVVVLSSVTESVATGPGRATWTGEDDMAGFTFEPLSCVHCTLELGKMWRATSREFDELRDNYCLQLNCLKIYEVGSSATQNEELPVQSDELFAGGFEARVHAQQAQHQHQQLGQVHDGPDGFALPSDGGAEQAEETQKMRMLLMAMGERLMRVERELDDLKRERSTAGAMSSSVDPRSGLVAGTPSALGGGGGGGGWGAHPLSAPAAARDRGGPRVSFSDDEPTPSRTGGGGGRGFAPPGGGMMGPRGGGPGMAGLSAGVASGKDRNLLNRMTAERGREREMERERERVMGPAGRRRRLV